MIVVYSTCLLSLKVLVCHVCRVTMAQDGIPLSCGRTIMNNAITALKPTSDSLSEPLLSTNNSIVLPQSQMLTADDTNEDSSALTKGEILPSQTSLSNQRRRDHAVRMRQDDFILRAVEERKNQAWYRNPQQIMAMLSNFSTSYNVVNISLVLPILKQLHPDSNSEDESAIASSLLAGMVVGQLVGGALGDSVYLGRLGALFLVMVLQVIASLASAFVAYRSTASTQETYIALAIWRFILGIGAGGVYPLAAVLSGEQGATSASNIQQELKLSNVVLTFSMQGIGFLAVPLVAVILLDSKTDLNLTWRLLLALGSVPGVILLIMQCCIRCCCSGQQRLTPIPQSDLHEEDQDLVEGGEMELRVEQFDHDESDGILRVGTEDADDDRLPERRGWCSSIWNEPNLVRKLIGTAGTWFFFDVLFYGNTLFQPVVIEAAFGKANSSSGSYDILRKTAIDSLILTSIALPGYFVAALLLGKRTCCVTQSPRFVTLQGFLAMSILYFVIGSNWDYLRQIPTALVVLYGLTFFFANYGPNTTTFVLPSLVYSPGCRSTLNGISAAAGKAGALVGATLFAPVANNLGDAAVMMICAAIGVFATFLTFCFVRIPTPDSPHLRTIVPTEEVL